MTAMERVYILELTSFCDELSGDGVTRAYELLGVFPSLRTAQRWAAAIAAKMGRGRLGEWKTEHDNHRIGDVQHYACVRQQVVEGQQWTTVDLYTVIEFSPDDLPWTRRPIVSQADLDWVDFCRNLDWEVPIQEPSKELPRI